MKNNKIAVVAIGGNSLITDKKHEDVPSQWRAVKDTCAHFADMVEQGGIWLSHTEMDPRWVLSSGAMSWQSTKCTLHR